VGYHPVEQSLEHERITAARAKIFAVGVLLTPVYSQPRRQLESVIRLLRAQDREILIIADELFQGGTVDHFRCRELCLERGPVRRRGDVTG